VAVAKDRFVCRECGAVYSKWLGKCEACGGWNTIDAEVGAVIGGRSKGRGRAVAFQPLSASTEDVPRFVTGMPELDRVTGGGFVPGSTILIGGDPGIGKSTLLLQATAALALRGLDCAYVTGEEAARQISGRARRLGLGDAPVRVAAANELRQILASIEANPMPRFIVIDSIQTLYSDAIEAAPGTVTQVRACAEALNRFAKRSESAVVLVGHVTKEGQLAGPRVVEHMVDTVLYFEGERGHQFRILRAVKNRYGATDEIGVFSMTDRGLAEVANPSALFLGARSGNVSGAAVLAGIEGTRPLLVEVQALVTPAPPGSPRRAVVGWDTGRLAMVLAVLDARCGLGLSAYDVYLNIAGGLRISEPAADLAVAAALLSSLADQPLPDETVVFGEISLAGEVRPVAQADARLKEAAKLGFAHAIVPAGVSERKQPLTLSEFGRLADILRFFPGIRRRARD
jgi:DNA repair protein RadA/Sms